MPNQWIEVDTDRLAGNVRAFHRRVEPGVRVAPVVKSNGYGHGLELAAGAFAEGGADWLCVHSLAEARRVAALGLGLEILILGPLADEELAEATAAGHQLTVAHPGRLRDLASTAGDREIPVHLKVETGTHRQGMDEGQLIESLEIVRSEPSLRLAGISSHFANIEDTTDHRYAQAQSERFHGALRAVEAAGLDPGVRHMASSAAAILFPDTHYDLIRPGISAYGYWPSRETLVSARENGLGDMELRPALRWCARVAELKTVPAGGYVGYGCAHKVEVDSRIAVLPVGYADGYRRAFSGHAWVLIRGRRCRVVGRVCMNLVMADVSHLPEVALDDEVVLLGRQGEEELPAETLGAWAGTIHYEVLAGLGPDLPRHPRRET